LQSIVDAAARIFGAAAASISLIDEAEGVLEFKVAYGVGKEDVVGRRIPLNEGIAGYVAMTGQPIAISDVQQDPRFAQDFAKSTGYVPRSILSTPLISNDQVIGVMQVLDKIDAPSFGMQDMELLGVFANQAAIAINQSQQYDLLGEALIVGLQDMVADEGTEGAATISEALADSEQGYDSLRHDMLQLARLINQLSTGGEAERKMCLQVLAAFGNYIQSQPRF
jgi:GAF domain-containing protein